jgi:acetyl-CoA acetyltransferase
MKAAIVGIGESPYRRRADCNFATLQRGAVDSALRDAGVTAADVEGIFTDALVMPRLFSSEAMITMYQMENVRRIAECSRGILYAVLAAFEAVSSGAIRTALVYLGTDWGSASGGPYSVHERFPLKPLLEQPLGFYGQPVYYAGTATRYAYDHGLSSDDLQAGLGELVVSTRENAARNPGAQLRESISHAAYADSRMVAAPLRVADCSLITDGAAALVITTAERASECPNPPVYLLGAGHGEQQIEPSGFFSQNPDYPYFPAATVAGRQAFAAAGLSPEGIDLYEIYDCFSISVILLLEDLGVCPRGEGLKFVADGRTRFDGPTPVNTHGGLLAHGHLVGINHVIEAVRQLRGSAGDAQVPDARTAMVAMPPNRYHTAVIFGNGQ